MLGLTFEKDGSTIALPFGKFAAPRIVPGTKGKRIVSYFNIVSVTLFISILLIDYPMLLFGTRTPGLLGQTFVLILFLILQQAAFALLTRRWQKVTVDDFTPVHKKLFKFTYVLLVFSVAPLGISLFCIGAAIWYSDGLESNAQRIMEFFGVGLGTLAVAGAAGLLGRRYYRQKYCQPVGSSANAHRA